MTATDIKGPVEIKFYGPCFADKRCPPKFVEQGHPFTGTKWPFGLSK